MKLNLKILGFRSRIVKSRREIVATCGTTKYVFRTIIPGGTYKTPTLFELHYGSQIVNNILSPYKLARAIGRIARDTHCQNISKEIEDFTLSVRTKFRAKGLAVTAHNNIIELTLHGRKMTNWVIRINPSLDGFSFTITRGGKVTELGVNQLSYIQLVNSLCTYDTAIFGGVFRGAAMREFVDASCIVLGGKTYHGRIISARVTDIVSLEGSRIMKCAEEPDRKVSCKVEIAVISVHHYTNYYKVITDGNRWGRYYEGDDGGGVVLPSTDFDLTTADRDLLSEAMSNFLNKESEAE
ncbi:MAG: hypothetical protein U9Q17_01400 [Chloroflexota bacterium]|nr:hypothetical protein [Chloroflexota bacterium]